MCLYIDDKETKLIKRRFREAKKRGQNYIICYKSLDYEEYKKNNYLISPFRSKKYTAGWNKSNRKNNILTNIEEATKEITKGIHLYSTYKSAIVNNNPKWLLPCICYQKDFISGGKYGECIFQKVFIRKKDYEKILKRLKKYYEGIN